MSKHKQILHFLLFFLASSINAQSSFPIHFHQITMEQGLSYNDVRAIYQDSYGFIWIGTRFGLNRFDGYEFKHFFYDSDDVNSLSANQISYIWEDASRNLWIATSSNVLSRYDRAKEVFERVEIPQLDNFLQSSFHKAINDTAYISVYESYQITLLNLKDQSLSSLVGENDGCKKANTIDFMLKDSGGDIWFSDWQTLYRYDFEKKEIECFQHDEKDEKSLSSTYVSAIFEDQRRRIWIGTEKGLNLWNPIERNFKRIFPLDYLPHLTNNFLNYINAFEEDQKGNLWLGTPDGLLYYDLINDRFLAYETEVSGLLGGGVKDLMMDENGMLWIGLGEGLCLLYPNVYQFDQGRHDILVSNTKDAANVKQFFKNSKGHYWLAAYYGLFQIQEIDGQIIRRKINESPFHSLFQAKNGTHYAGTTGNGVFHYREADLLQHFPYDKARILGSQVWGIAVDNEENLWVATANKLNRYSPISDQFIYYNDSTLNKSSSVDLSNAYFLYEDRQRNLWISTSKGLLFLDHEEVKKPFGTPLKFKGYYYESGNPQSLSSSYTSYIYQATDGTIWIGTENGLNRFENGQFKRYQEGALQNKIMSILEDEVGDLWVGTTNGLCHFNLKTNTTTDYTTADGLPSNRFLFPTCMKEEDGTLVFGTEKGIISFQPKDLKRNKRAPKVYLTDFKLFNQSVKVGEYDSLLTKSIKLTDETTLKHHQNVLTFQFAALNYFDAENNEYAYQMIGFDDTLQYIGNRREVAFTNLDAGDYTFWVKASNNHGVWNEEGVKLKIQILPPWYRTWWAYALWTALLGAAIFAFYRFQLNRQLAEAEAARLKELDTVKTNLYTNITHEFRTPLTVILGMAKNIQNGPHEWSQKGAKMIERNGQNLLDLVNQMLDLSKLEAGKLAINMVQGDLVAYLHYLVESFHSWARDKKVKLHYLPEIETLMMDYDAEKMQAIVSNLLSNAIKFTPAEGSIYLQVQKINETEVLLKVKDTGKGIAAEGLEHIFDRFYQTDTSTTREGEGTGIGLAFTKALVELLGGRIEVKSALGKGSTFSVILPITNQASSVQSIINSATTSTPTSKITSKESEHITNVSAPLVLIVEDNQDVIQYLESCLQADYRLVIAKNGQEGINKALELLPDLIISDVMMPQKNGFELCESLKNNPQSSHIPIILLTAKADIDSKLVGLSTGADAYLPKPFEKQELLIRIQKLLELRQKLRQYYTSADFLNRPIPPTENQDEIFLHQLKTHIEKLLDSPDLDVELLCKKMGFSRTAFYTKVNALVGTPPATYIRLVRLNYAKKLLLQTDLSITEIAYQCGFSSQSLFTRVFKTSEGVSPSIFRAN